jgi:antitoxin component of RelBE/YafQ-DinJ toxin-antitoxin module
MTEKKEKETVNLSLSAEEKDELREFAERNGMSISALVRFLAAKAIDDPRKYGLLPTEKK